MRVDRRPERRAVLRPVRALAYRPYAVWGEASGRDDPRGRVRLVCVRGPSPSGRRCRRRWLGGAWTVVAAGYAKRTGHGATPHTASLRCLRSARTSTYDYPLDYLLELR